MRQLHCFYNIWGSCATRPLNVNKDDMSGVKIIKIMSLIRLHIVCGGHMCTYVHVRRYFAYVRGRAINDRRLV